MAELRQDHEDVSGFTLSPEREEELRRRQRECTFIWTNKAGEPVGMIMSYLETPDGHLWLTGSEQRKRFSAVRRDPRTCVVISSSGTDMGFGLAITYKGKAILHPKDDRRIKDWFYRAFAEKQRGPHGEAAVRQFIRLLDSPRRVVMEFIPSRTIAFDGHKHQAADNPLELEPGAANQ